MKQSDPDHYHSSAGTPTLELKSPTAPNLTTKGGKQWWPKGACQHECKVEAWGVRGLLGTVQVVVLDARLKHGAYAYKRVAAKAGFPHSVS